MGDPLNLAICGFGLVGQRHAAAAAKVPGVRISAVVDASEGARDRATQDGLTVFRTLDEMFLHHRPDGVIVATPTALHVEHGLVAIAQDCPVLIEKPIATDVASAQGLVNAAEARGVPLLVGHHRRHNPIIQRAHEIISRGEIGEIRAVTASCWFYKPDSYFDSAPWRKNKGAGPVSVNLVHDIDLIRHLCGEVTRVSAEAAPARRGYANEDVAAALLTLSTGALATISVSDSIAAPWSWEMTSGEVPIYPRTSESCYQIGGSRGALSLPDLRLWRHDGPAPDWWTPISATTQPHSAADPLVNQIKHFHDVIRGTQTPLVSGEEGLRSLRVVEAIQSSAHSGTAVTIATEPSDAAHNAA